MEEVCLFCEKPLTLHIPKKGIYSDPEIKLYRCKHSKCKRYNRNTIPGLTSTFYDFWKAYPRKVGKAMCKQLWFKLQPDKELVLTIIDSVNKYTESIWSKNSIGFTPHPETFLRQCRWEDDIDTEIDTRKKEVDKKIEISYNQPPKGYVKKPAIAMTGGRDEHIRNVIKQGREALAKGKQTFLKKAEE